MPKTHQKTRTSYSQAAQRSIAKNRRGFPLKAGLQSSPIEISSDEETSTEVLIISSDEAENDGKSSSLRPGGRPLQGRKVTIPGHEIPIAIDRQNGGGQESHELELEKLRQERKGFVKAVSEAKKAVETLRVRSASEITQLKAELAREKERHISAVKTLTNIMTCDICSERMSKPVTLKCGHTFCQTCVSSWFSTIEGRHRVDESLSRQHTCPMCRKSVGRPVECFKLREVLSAVEDATPTD